VETITDIPAFAKTYVEAAIDALVETAR